jgi:hypothetical protein
MPKTLITLMLLLPPLALAELVIDLTDGRSITVPVDRNEVKGIRFLTGSPSQVNVPPEKQTSAASASAESQGRQIWRVGPDRSLKFPSDAAKKAKDGDVIEIDAGVYPNDYAKWKQNDLTIRGVGGMAHLKSRGLIPNGKAIWITAGNNIRIENIEFSGAAVRDTNGSGIRHEGGDLTLHNTFFHDNEFSILSGKRPDAAIEISDSRFWFQRRPTRHSHGIYIGVARRFTLIGNHFKGTDRGHQVKSRALENHILYNRIEDVPGGNSSRLIDLSNCGLSFVIGNDLHQAATSQNFNAIGYGPEGCEGRTEQQMRLYVVHNTFINEATDGAFVRNFAGGGVLVANNLILGEAVMLAGGGVVRSNLQIDPDDRMPGTWNAPKGSDALDAATIAPPVDGISLTPTREFYPPAGTRDRPKAGRLDIGSREHASP